MAQYLKCWMQVRNHLLLHEFWGEDGQQPQGLMWRLWKEVLAVFRQQPLTWLLWKELFAVFQPQPQELTWRLSKEMFAVFRE